MDIKKLTKNNIDEILEKIKEGDESIFGKYLYKNVKLIITRKTPFSNRERSKKFYQRRRAKGLCIICGEKVTDKNPRTKKAYRYCDQHRKEESANRKKKRANSKKK